MRILPGPRFLLPLTVIVGTAVLGLRINDVRDAAASGRLFAPMSHAQAADAATPPATPAAAPASTDTPAQAPAADASKSTSSAAPSASSQDIAIPDDATPAEIEVLKQLSNRRQQLDKRAQDLDAREDLLKVAEQRVDQKIKDMETLRKQLQAMVNQASESQAAQLDNLVKIYETMKPGDAAKIFEALDMPTLLNVVQRMKPARTAPIMAQMAPEKAKEVTVALTKQDKLPQVK